MSTRSRKLAASIVRGIHTTDMNDPSEVPENNVTPTKKQKTRDTAKSVTDSVFEKTRVRLLSDINEVSEDSNGIVYWMSRDQRVQDNWALLYAQRLAFKCSSPLHVCFCLANESLEANTLRHRDFLLRGLEEVEQECSGLNISFHLLQGEPLEVLFKFLKQNNIGGIVTDFNPLRIPSNFVNKIKENLSKKITFCQVDAHNIVPCWETSGKLEYGARTIRKKIQTKLYKFLTDFPPVVSHVFSPVAKAEKVDWKGVMKSLKVDRQVGPVDWAVPGSKAGLEMLEEFCTERLKDFAALRNDPTKMKLSNLSPWLHFGHISAQRCALRVKELKRKYSESVDVFLEEAIIRRELADNFCFYNPNYDNLEGTNEWARKTLANHRSDKRQYLYSREQFEECQTHDDLWNAAQMQMVRDGKMHGFLRMYWAKKILEWSSSPEEALATAIYLNDKFELDGSDPNGFVGCMWSIAGIHDQGWAERPIFGKIRYMNYKGCQRKFDVPAFVARYSSD